MLKRADPVYRQHLALRASIGSFRLFRQSVCVPCPTAKVQRHDYHPIRPAMHHAARTSSPVQWPKGPSRAKDYSADILRVKEMSMIDAIFAGGTTKDAILKKIGHSTLLREHLVHREKARSLAEAMVHTPFPQRAHRVLLLAHKVGCRLKQNAYECVAFQLAEKRHWHLIPSLVLLGKRHTGRTTVRLLNWHARALLEMSQYALLDNILDEFEQGDMKPNRTTFHLLISGHIRNRCLGKARECLQKMEQGGFPVDASTHAVIVSVYRSLGPDSQVQVKAFEALPHVDDHIATTILNSVMQLRIDAHDLPGTSEVLALFNQHPVSSSLNLESGACFTQGAGNNILHNTILTRQSYVSPDAATFSMLINYMTTRRDLPGASRMLQRMMLSGIRPDAGIVAAIMRAYFVMGNEGTAISMMMHMCNRRIWRLFSPFISVPVDENGLPLIPTGIPLTTEVLNTLLKGVLTSRGLNSAHVVLRIMRASNLRPDADTVNILVAHLDEVEHASPGVLIRTIRRLLSPGVPPTLTHVHAIFRSVLRHEKYLVHGHGWNVVSAQFSRQRQDKSLYPENRISGTANSFDPTAGIELPLKLRYRSLLRPIVQSLTGQRVSSDRATIALRIRHEAVTKSNLEAAREIFRTMLSRGLHPNEYHFSALMEGYALSGDLTAAEGVMESAARVGVKPNIVMFTILIAGHARQGNPDLAMRSFRNMVAAGIKPDVPAIDAVSSAYFAVGAYAMARRVLLSLWPYVQPFPEEMREASLKYLIREFRLLHGGNVRGDGIISKQQRLMLHRKLKGLVEAWAELLGRPWLKRGIRKSVHSVSHSSPKSQKIGLP